MFIAEWCLVCRTPLGVPCWKCFTPLLQLRRDAGYATPKGVQSLFFSLAINMAPLPG